jgi:hypothetical protein
MNNRLKLSSLLLLASRPYFTSVHVPYTVAFSSSRTVAGVPFLWLALLAFPAIAIPFSVAEFPVVIFVPICTVQYLAFLHAVVSFPAVAGTIALAHIAVGHHFCINRLSRLGTANFLCFRTTGLSNIGLGNSRSCLRSNLRISLIPM